jgi:centromeric protein E
MADAQRAVAQPGVVGSAATARGGPAAAGAAGLPHLAPPPQRPPLALPTLAAAGSGSAASTGASVPRTPGGVARTAGRAAALTALEAPELGGTLLNTSSSSSNAGTLAAAPDGQPAPISAPSAPTRDARDANVTPDAVMVSVRVRPLNEREAQLQRLEPSSSAWQYNDRSIIDDNDVGRKAYNYDRVFGPGSSNADVYRSCARPVVQMALRGYNGTVFAYGQTGSGKTFSMLGSDRDPGVIPRAIDDVFSHVEAATARGSAEFLIRVSYLEVYNEEINDLLQPIVKGKGRNLKILRDDPSRGAVIEGLLEEIVVSQGQVLDVVARGEANRHYGSTGECAPGVDA